MPAPESMLEMIVCRCRKPACEIRANVKFWGSEASDANSEEED